MLRRFIRKIRFILHHGDMNDYFITQTIKTKPDEIYNSTKSCGCRFSS